MRVKITLAYAGRVIRQRSNIGNSWIAGNHHSFTGDRARRGQTRRGGREQMNESWDQGKGYVRFWQTCHITQGFPLVLCEA